jgi:hypothetical protein
MFVLANVSLFTIQHLQSNLQAMVYTFTKNGLMLQKRFHSLKEQMNRKKEKQLIIN